MTALAVLYSVSASGEDVAEASVDDLEQGRELAAVATAAKAAVAWAHSVADLSPLGFRPAPGYRRLAGPGRPLSLPAQMPRQTPLPDGVTVLTAAEDSAELCAVAYRDQWGHKTPGTWPVEEFAGATALGLRSGGRVVGVCRVGPAPGLIDAPGLVPGHRDVTSYRTLLATALAAAGTERVTVESWGDGPDRVAVCTELGLETVEYCPGWELRLAG